MKSAMRTALLAATLFVSAPALAAGSAADAIQAMKELNLIVLGDVAMSQEVEGKTFIGGNLSGGGQFGIGNAYRAGHQGQTETGLPTLMVNGNVSGGAYQLENGLIGAGPDRAATNPGLVIGGNSVGWNINAAGATFDVGGNVVGNMNANAIIYNVGGNLNGINTVSGTVVNAGGAVTGNLNGSPVINANLGTGWNAAATSDVTAAKLTKLDADMKALSSLLAGLTIVSNPSSITPGAQGPTFNAVDSGAGYALFNVSPADFGPELFFNSSTTSPIIVNVSGTNINWTSNAVSGYTEALNRQIIWNFYEATNIFFDRIVYGSVLAPYAHITNTTPIEGSVVAASLRMNGEIHLGTYDLGTPFITDPNPPVGGVPEPATWAMLIAGFGMVGAAVRRRKAVAA